MWNYFSIAVKQIMAQSSGFKQQEVFIISEFLWVRNLALVQLGDSWCKVSHEFAGKILTRAAVV